MFCTMALVLSEVCVLCQIRLFVVVVVVVIIIIIIIIISSMQGIYASIPEKLCP